jgi:predicted AAA+ superfamily ATPase
MRCSTASKPSCRRPCRRPTGRPRAFRWRKRGGRGWLEAVKQPHRIRFEDLQGVEDQKQRIAQNTKQFVAGRSANNVLLTGARGTGKSSLVKAVLNQFAAKGLRLIEVDKDDLVHLPEIVDLIASAASASSSSATTFPSSRASPATRR